MRKGPKPSTDDVTENQNHLLHEKMPTFWFPPCSASLQFYSDSASSINSNSYV